MNSEELTQEPARTPMQFDAHEFDGLREVFEKDAETIFAKVDQYVRENPWLSIGLAAAAGFAVGYALQGGSKSESGAPARDRT